MDKIKTQRLIDAYLKLEQRGEDALERYKHFNSKAKEEDRKIYEKAAEYYGGKFKAFNEAKDILEEELEEAGYPHTSLL